MGLYSFLTVVFRDVAGLTVAPDESSKDINYDIIAVLLFESYNSLFGVVPDSTVNLRLW